MTAVYVFVSSLLLVLFVAQWRRAKKLQRAAYIRKFAFPPGVLDQVHKRHPQLNRKELELVAQGLRQFFLAYHHSGHRFVAMPSQVADDLWHEFILYTRHYSDFCRRAFGRFLHHTPAVVLRENKHTNAGLRRCWQHACREENIQPRSPSRLPLLFALDGKLNIPNGFHYTPDCSGIARAGAAGNVYCGGDFASSAIDGGTDGLSDGSHGDGGDGCGGGCGGGGD